jgi:hypothetical protein
VRPTSIRPPKPQANRANIVTFTPVTTSRLRIVFEHRPGSGVGLAQVQALAPS